MNLSEVLVLNKSYTRPELARLWGLGGIQGINRGVYTPAKQRVIFLFVTRIKQSCLTQYNDYLEEDLLFWEGENGHGSDERIAAASSKGEEIHLFYRERHHSAFIYHGKVIEVTEKDSVITANVPVDILGENKKKSARLFWGRLAHGLQSLVAILVGENAQSESFLRQKTIICNSSNNVPYSIIRARTTLPSLKIFLSELMFRTFIIFCKWKEIHRQYFPTCE